MMIAKLNVNQFKQKVIFKILVNDVALALLNALKLPETAGRTYELGGPNVYSMLEAYDILHNYIEQPPKLAYFNK